MQISELESLRRRIGEAKEKRSRSEGALEQVMARLRSEHGVDTIEQAEELAETLRKRLADMQAVYDEKSSDLRARLDKAGA